MDSIQLAATAGAVEAAAFVDKVNSVILFPLIELLSAIAFLVFIYGSAQYIMNAASDQGREEGKKHITYGLIGLTIMMSAYALLQLAAGTFGLTNQLNCADNPNGTGCDSAFTLP